MPLFVLIHSPSVGPASWLPVAQRLQAAGCEVAVPSLLGIGEGEPPFWPRVVAAVAAGLAGRNCDQPLVLVAHSNAGVFMPVIADGLGRPVTCSIFADATVPAAAGRTPMAPAELLPFLRGLAGPDGRLPRWTDWWDEADVAPMFPDPVARQVVTGEQARLPLAYYLEQVPATCFSGRLTRNRPPWPATAAGRCGRCPGSTCIRSSSPIGWPAPCSSSLSPPRVRTR